MWHMFPVLIIDTNLIEHYSIICLSLKATVAKRCTGLGKLVKFVGQPAVDAVLCMAWKRQVWSLLWVFSRSVRV